MELEFPRILPTVFTFSSSSTKLKTEAMAWENGNTDHGPRGVDQDPNGVVKTKSGT
jgi:hypothetical protein